MHALSAAIRRNDGWWTKVDDPATRAQHMENAVGAPVPYGTIPLRKNEVAYVLDELVWYASQRDADTGIEVRVGADVVSV